MAAIKPHSRAVSNLKSSPPLPRADILRRTDRRPLRGIIRVGDLTVDPMTRAVRLEGQPVHLSAKEFALLHALAADPTRVFGKAELLRDVWGYVSISNRRQKSPRFMRRRARDLELDRDDPRQGPLAELPAVREHPPGRLEKRREGLEVFRCRYGRGRHIRREAITG